MAKTAKANFRESMAHFGQIRSAIAAGNIAPVYLLMGEEDYFIDALTDLFVNNIVPEHEAAFDRTIVYGKETEGAAVANACKRFPMMAQRQVVVVREAQGMKKPDGLASYMKAPQPSTVLVICHKTKPMDKRSALYKAIAGAGEVFESAPPRDYEIGPWLSQMIKARGLSIEDRAATMIVDHIGTDLPRISNEVAKLLVRLPEGTKNITAAQVEENIGISREFNNFELTAALSERNLAKALRIADHFAKDPKDNPFTVTIASLFTHFRRIFMLNYHRWAAKRGARPMPSEADLMRELKLTNAFFLKEYQLASNNYPNNKVFAILGLLRTYDMKSKGIDGGSADDGELLKELLMKIVML